MKKNQLAAILLLAAGVWNCESRTGEQAETLATSEDGSLPAITGASDSLPLSRIQLPEGFSISIFAEVDNARSLAMSPSGTIYVGNRGGDKVFAVRDVDGDFRADKKWIVADSLNTPNGVAFKDGDLYVAEISRILKFSNVEENLKNPGKPEIIADDFPTETHHGWKYIAFGPDGKLYVPVGAPCNICDPEEDIFATITRINADGGGREIYAHGVRNTVGFTWHPDTQELWFTDNGRDMMGDDVPHCELNHAPTAGLHFGYPYCHEGSVIDPEFGGKRKCNEFVAPVEKLGPHVAPLGLKFYTGSKFPEAYRKNLLIARHGSWNRSKKSGYNIALVKIQGNKSVGSETFASGWLDEKTQNVWGRPVDVLELPDGSVLVSDDYANVIYRISYGE